MHGFEGVTHVISLLHMQVNTSACLVSIIFIQVTYSYRF